MNAASPFDFIGIASFSFGAIVICVTCLVYMALHGRFEKLQSKLFLAVIVILLANALSSMVAEVLKEYALTSDAIALAVRVSNYTYFLAHTALAPMVCLYFFVVCGSAFRLPRSGYVLCTLPFLITELFAIVNPLTNWVYYYGADMAFTRNWAIYCNYVAAAFYIVFGIAILMRRWQALTPVKRRAIAYFFIMVCFGVVVQLLYPEVRLELFAEAVAILGLMLFVENEEGLIDSETGVYNRQALVLDLDSSAKAGEKPLYIIAVRVSTAEAYNRLGDTILQSHNLAIMLTDYFKQVTPWYHVYRTASMRFVLADPQWDIMQAAECAHMMARRFSRSWPYGDMNVTLHADIALACMPADLPSPEDVFYLVDTPVPRVSDGMVLRGDDLNYLVRRAEIERAVQRGFEEGGYEVYFQPVVRADGSVYGAEALMRLNDSVLGSVSPIEFIKAAERLGLIEGIGDIAVRQTCAFLQSGVPQKLGINIINVNLSVLECMQADFIGRVRAAIAEYGVDPGSIGFEITESIAAGDYAFLHRVMSQLKNAGHRFSLDDFGTGYANMHSLFELNFDVAKIDKSLLWDAEKSKAGMAIMESSVRLLRDVGCRVLVEGVETESQFELLQSLNVDYCQGFHFAEPMPKDKFVAYVEQHQV